MQLGSFFYLWSSKGIRESRGSSKGKKKSFITTNVRNKENKNKNLRKCFGDGASKMKRNLCILKTADKCPVYTDYFTRSKECREKECKNELEARKLDTTLLQSDTRKAVNECFNRKCSDLSID